MAGSDRNFAQAHGEAIVISPPHEPTPRIEAIERPDGKGQAFVVKTGPDRWEVKTFDAPTEGVARHTFASLDSLVRWLQRWGEASRAQVFVDVQAGNTGSAYVQARLDPGDPEGDRVTCPVPFTPEFRAWVIDTRGKALGQRELFALVRAFGSGIQDQTRAASLLGALSVLRIAGGSELECELAPNGRTKVSGRRGDVAMSQELPGELELVLPIYRGVQVDDDEALADEPATYRLRMMLDVEASPALGLAASLVFPDLESVLADAADDLVEHLERELGEGWVVCAGSEETEAVDVRKATRIGRGLG